MMGVEEVGNKMQSQMRLDAAAVAAEDEDLPLPALFDKASRLHSLASSSSLDQVRFRISSPPAFPVTQGIGRALTWCVCCRAGQEGVRKGVDLLRRCDEMVSNLGLFSSNESKEDVSTINLKYLLVCPFSFSRICIYSASWCFVESLSYCPVKTTIELFI
jgi:immunoglobulin-binding protein 1